MIFEEYSKDAMSEAYETGCKETLQRVKEAINKVYEETRKLEPCEIVWVEILLKELNLE